MTFFDPRKRDIFGGTSQVDLDSLKKLATGTNNQQVLDTIKKQQQEKIRDTMLGTNTSGNTTTQSTVPKTATGTVGGTPQSASGNTQTANNTLVKGGESTYAQINSEKNTGMSTNKTAGGSTAKANVTGTPVINPLAPKSNTPAYTDIAGQKDYAKTLGDKLGSGQNGTDGKSYVTESLDQLVRGNYSGDVTGLGTTLQVISGILGLDTAADVRDLYYDVTHWDGSKEHIIQTLLDVVGLIPVVGSLKYADEVGTLVKQGLKGADEAGEVAATATKKADKQVYELPAGYKPSLNFTDEQLAKEWKTPKSTTPSLNFTDEELLKSWKAPEKGAVSNAVEDGGNGKIAGKNGTGYNKEEDISNLSQQTKERVIDNAADELFVADQSFLNDQGVVEWAKHAPDGGFIKETVKYGQRLEVGMEIDRYGNDLGKYVSPVGTSYAERSLPYYKNQQAYHRYIVIKPIENIIQGKVASAFNQPGGGTQMELMYSIRWLVKNEFLKEVK